MVFEKLSSILASRLGIDEAAIAPESTFEELGVDSLDVMEILMLIEDEFGKEIELEGEKLVSMKDLVKLVETKLGE
jgi:acyl carrier protein